MSNNLLIVFPSWEERSNLGAIRDIESFSISSVLLLGYSEPVNNDEIEENINRITDYCQRNSITSTRALLSRESKLCWHNLNEEISKLNLSDDVDIVLDISTIPRNILWLLLSFIGQIRKAITIVYHQPLTYTDSWVSRDPSTPRLLLKHSGIMEIGISTALIIITSYDIERTRQIVSSFEPSKVILLVQQGTQLNNSIRNNGEEHRRICQSCGNTDTKVIEIDSFSDDFGYDTICNAISDCKGYNTVLASFGPKTSAIGVYKAFLSNPAIALCYVPCNEYNINYCEGIGRTFKQKLELY